MHSYRGRGKNVPGYVEEKVGKIELKNGALGGLRARRQEDSLGSSQGLGGKLKTRISRKGAEAQRTKDNAMNAKLLLQIWVALALLVGPLALAEDAEKKSEALPRKVREAWEKAGVVSGWLHPDGGILSFGRSPGGGTDESVPAFRAVIEKWQPGAISRLPQPE